MSDPGVPTADFAFAQEFCLRCDYANRGYVVEDSIGHAVALLPRWLGGEVRTRTERWDVQTERARHSWAIIARSVADGAEVGGVAQRLLPNIYRLWIVPGTTYHLIQNPLSDSWAVRDRHLRLARLSGLGTFATGGFDPRDPRALVGSIKTFDGPINPAPIALTILLALEMVKAQALIPRSSAPGTY
jgi:hypothetical protein